MILFDVNVLVYAFRPDMPDHARYRNCLETVISRGDAFAVADLVLCGFIRIVTNPRIFKSPTTLSETVDFCQALRERPQCRVLSPGPRHWTLFTDLCQAVSATGNLISDAYLAAMAIEGDCEIWTTDRDFRRFPGLRWRHPLE